MNKILGNNRSFQIPSLNGLRAVSVIMVLLGHSFNTLPIHNAIIDTSFIFIGNAHIGVMTFFIISGYLITYLLRKEWEKTDTLNLRSFYWRRMVRIFPPFYSYLLVIALLKYFGVIDISLNKLLTAATFSINYGHLWANGDTSGPYYWFVGHFWSLSLEEQFYLLWPATLLLIGLSKAKRVALFIIIISPLIRILTYFLFPQSRGQIGMMLQTSSDSLMVGCLMALLQGNLRFENVVTKLLNRYVIVAAFLLAIVISPILLEKFRGAYHITIGFSLEIVSIGLIVLYVIRLPNTFIGRILNQKILNYIGILSYSLYLWQQLFLTPGLNATWSGKFPLNLLACFAVAFVSYNLIEKPALRLKDKFKSIKHSNDNSSETGDTGINVSEFKAAHKIS